MKNLLKKVLPIIGMVMVMTTATYANEVDFGSGAVNEGSSYTLEEMLDYALQDEQMAQAEYQAIMETFGEIAPFSNIAQAEVSHEEAVLRLYDLYDIEIPSFDASDHVVVPATLEETYAIGVQAEIANIAMYEAFLATDLDDAVRTVFESLKNASEYHQAAFERGVENGGSQVGSASRNGQDLENGQANGNRGNSNASGSRNGSSDARDQRGQGNKGQMISRRSQQQDLENCEIINN